MSDVTFYDFLDYMFVDPVERLKVSRWIAQLIRNPLCRHETGLFLVGPQGVGKSFLWKQIVTVLMKRCYIQVRPEELLSDFNSWLDGTGLIILDPVEGELSSREMDRLNSLMSEDLLWIARTVIDRTGVDKSGVLFYPYNNTLSFLAASNVNPPERLLANRRWFIPRLTEDVWEEYKFRKLYSWLKDGGLENVVVWALEQRDF